jgi:hypothetical protein
MIMSEARTVRHVMEARRSEFVNHQRASVMLAVVLLCVVAVAEVVFLNFVAAPGSAEMMQQAEGTALPP